MWLPGDEIQASGPELEGLTQPENGTPLQPVVLRDISLKVHMVGNQEGDKSYKAEK